MLLTILCLVAGFAALAGMGSVVAVLLFGLGLSGLLAAFGFGLTALATGLWAGLLAMAPRPEMVTEA